ncbi:MAG: hypothetical protein LQ350_008179 [Teloschistes chrysophthalmus]|nr:MAG: hypothetical protein LQ350_008179 [Niorma chrysophthalma]
MSFQHLSSPTPSQERIESKKRPHLSVFRFASFQNTNQAHDQAPPAYSRDDTLAERNQMHAKVLHWMRIAIALVSLVLSLIIIAFSGNVLRIYNDTRYNNVEWILPLWPATVDLRPARALVACGVVLAVFSLIYVVLALAPTSLRSIRPLNLVSTLLAFLSLFITIFTTAYSSTIDNHLSDNTQAGTLASWTCKWQGFSSVAPGRFADICSQSTAALDLVILMIVIEVLHVLLAGWGWWVGAKMKKVGGEKGIAV